MERREMGWIPDLPDRRDRIFSSARLLKDVITMPAKMDLRYSFPDPYDQGNLGSCTAQAVGAICDFKYGLAKDFQPSALFLYYNTRVMEGTTRYDAGAMIRTAIKAANVKGICDEKLWPYIVSKFSDKPALQAFREAREHQALKYRRVRQNLLDLKSAIADKLPVAFGFSVYQSFYELDATNYTIKTPDLNEPLLGGHAVVIVGYDDEKQVFIIRNSWGKEFGYEGHFLMPYSFILDQGLCSDFWTIEIMEGE